MNNLILIKDCVVTDFKIEHEPPNYLIGYMSLKAPNDEIYKAKINYSIVFLILTNKNFEKVFEAEFKKFKHDEFKKKLNIIIEDGEVISIIDKEVTVNVSVMNLELYEKKVFAATLEHYVPKNNISNKKTKI